jgi:uncharacterized PurR-regulated membrane protein YhhQ (DUF165 family)
MCWASTPALRKYLGMLDAQVSCALSWLTAHAACLLTQVQSRDPQGSIRGQEAMDTMFAIVLYICTSRRRQYGGTTWSSTSML